MDGTKKRLVLKIRPLCGSGFVGTGGEFPGRHNVAMVIYDPVTGKPLGD